MQQKSITLDNVRLIPRESAFLNRKLGSRGEIFFDQESATLRLFDGVVDGGIPLLRADLQNIDGVLGASIGDTPPAGVRAGTLWFNSANGKLYVYYYDGTSYQWVQPTVPSYGGGSGGATFIDDLSDVTITSPTAGQVLSYDGTRWINSTASGGGGGSGTISNGTIGNLAYYTGTNTVDDITTVNFNSGQLNITGTIKATGEKSYVKFHWENLAELQNEAPAATWHGMVAHVHAEGRLYFAHSGSWVAVANLSEAGGGSAIPTQSGNGGKYLTTDGTNLSWATVTSGGSSTFDALTDAVTAGITVDEIYLQAIVRWSVTNTGSTAYNFASHYSGNNPTLYAIGGYTVAFKLDVQGHPFLIQDGTGTNYNTGLIHVDLNGVVSTGSMAQGKTTGTLYWNVPSSVSGTYRYQCSAHAPMVGSIVVKNIVSL